MLVSLIAVLSRALTKLLTFIKMRTYSKNGEELWLDEWHNPLERDLPISDPSVFIEDLQRPYMGREG